MKDFRIRVSLRFKLLLLLITLPLISLGLYLFIATDLFKSDKKAYVYDSSAAVSRALATQMRMEIQSTYSGLRSLADTFDLSQGDFPQGSKDLFQKDPRSFAMVLFRKDSESGKYVKLAQLVKEQPAVQKFALDDSAVGTVRDQGVFSGTYISEYDELPGAVKVAFRLGAVSEPNHIVLVALHQAEELLNAFQDSSLYSSFALTRKGQISIGGMSVVGTDLTLLRNILESKATDSAADVRLSDGLNYLISYSSVGIGDLVVVSKVDRAKAFKAVEILVAKSLLFFVALIASTLIISVFASNRLTSTLRELFEATNRMAAGDFAVRVESRSQDEVGGLAESFNFMAGEVSRLMTATAEKARMESELSTVKTVQETLFPPSEAQFGPLRISGHFEPASECGGDWWNYSRIDNKILLWVGDATGHGAPAALITSAARSAAVVIESLPAVTPALALTIMNKAIHQTSKGQIMMTFFIASIDLDKKTFTYSSASHDPPYLLRRRGETFSKKDLMPLNDVNGPRLGDRLDFVYEETMIDFEPGDLVFFYTDGILDIQNPEGKKWGERNFLKSLIDSANNGQDISAKLSELLAKVNAYRSGAHLIDDVTMVMCEYEKKEAA